MSESIRKLMAGLRAHPEVLVEAPRGLPALVSSCALPLDLRYFYEVAGGMTLFPDADYPARIVGPGDLVKTNKLLWQGESSEVLSELASDRSWQWYALVSDEKGDYLSIDLAPTRLGRCYDSFRDHHAVPGESPVIAKSFTDLLRRLFDNRGERWYWLRSEFVGLGDAYD